MRWGWLTGGAVVAIACAVVATRLLAHRPPPPPVVRVETVGRHTVVATVTATGQLEPHTKVDVIADVTGRVMRIGVREGDHVKAGQFLLQIDPAQSQAAVDHDDAAVATAQAALVQARTNLGLAEREYHRMALLEQNPAAGVVEEELDKLRTAVMVDSALLQSSVHAVDQANATLAASRSALAKTTIVAPMDGEVTRLGIGVGETAITGLYSRDAATLLTISDMSVLETKVQVPEGDVARLDVGDSAVITIDALPDSSFSGHVVTIAHSSVHDQTTGANNSSASTGAKAVNYEVTVRLDRVPRRIRPDFSATAKMIAAVRPDAVGVPIIALAIRQQPGHDEEGVYIVGPRDSIHFRPLSIGITGDQYAEVVTGVAPNERIVAGPYEVLRTLKDGAPVRTK